MLRCRGERAVSSPATDIDKVNLIMWPCTHRLPFDWNGLTSWYTCTPTSYLEQCESTKTITMPRGLESALPLKSTWQQMIFCAKDLNPNGLVVITHNQYLFLKLSSSFQRGEGMKY